MESLAAFGVAGNVVQLVQFSARLASLFRELTSSGSLMIVKELEDVTAHLLDQTRNIRHSLRLERTASAPQSDEEKHIGDIVAHCERLGLSFLSYLQSIPEHPHPSPWQNAKTALKLTFGRSKLDGFSKRLDTLRQEISFHLVLSLKKASEERHNETGTKIDGLGADIRTLIRLFQSDNRTMDLLVKQHNEVLQRFISTLHRAAQGNGAPTEVCDPRLPSRTKPASVHRDSKLYSEHNEYNASDKSQPDEMVDRVQDNTSDRHDALINRNEDTLQGHTISEEAKLRCNQICSGICGKKLLETLDGLESSKRDKVLNSLHHRHMLDRQYEIEKAYTRTFDWLFKTAGKSESWDDFISFLKSKSPMRPYWINGKAGSGKSTLMKYISRHQKTAVALRSWASPAKLVIASFYFWNMGTTMQKSQMGLLKSLLYQILAEEPMLIQTAFADIWPIITGTGGDMQYLSFAEAKRAFHNLFKMPELPIRICLFVDGLDEFDGDYLELATFLSEICSSAVKLIISSRPINACYETFGDCNSLRLEDLTCKDIEIFVNGNLTTNRHMMQLMQHHPEETHALVVEVSSTASGVFLWVKLVVASLLSGLRDGDDVGDLRRRLKELPPDLEDLFQHMLNKLNPLYKEQASQYFQIFREGIKLLDRPFKVIDMCFAEAGNEACLSTQILDFGMPEVVRKSKILEKRLRSRCCGLLELYWQHGRPGGLAVAEVTLLTTNYHMQEDKTLLGARVQYLHRSVAEFLHRKDVWANILRQTEGSTFNVHQRLSHAWLANLNIIKSLRSLHLTSVNDAKIYAEGLLHCEQLSEDCVNVSQTAVVDDMVLVLQDLWTNAAGWTFQYWPGLFRYFRESKVLDDPHDLDADQYMFILAVYIGLYSYVQAKLSQRDLAKLYPQGIPLIHLTLDSQLPEERKPTLSVRRKMTGTLLAHGADPNESFEGSSFWQRALEGTLSASDEDVTLWGGILKDCIVSSADPDLTVALLDEGFVEELSPSEIIEKAFIERAEALQARERRRGYTEPDSLDAACDSSAIKNIGLRLKKLLERGKLKDECKAGPLKP